jgi:lipoyl(octanoyl) transferase
MTIWIHKKEPIEYNLGLNLMDDAVEDIIKNNSQNVIFLLEHKDVFTTGASSKDQKSPIDNIPLIKTNRGGKITYHGPGQRIIYPIIDLRKMQDIKKYVSMLQDWIIASLEYFDIASCKIDGYPGVWTFHNGSYKKIASIGIRARKWISYHGIAININNTMEYFKKIEACGINDIQMISMSEHGLKINLEEFDSILKIEYTKRVLCY